MAGFTLNNNFNTNNPWNKPLDSGIGVDFATSGSGVTANPIAGGGTSSLGGAGWKAYLGPAPSGFQVNNQPSQSSGIIPAPQTGMLQGQSIGGTTTGGVPGGKTQGIPDVKKTWTQDWTDKSKNQWDKFMGNGEYAEGGAKAGQAVGLQDKMSAGFTLASLVANAFDR